MKKCTKCKIEKELNKFTKSSSDKNGYQSICKRCKADADKLRKKEAKFYKQFEIC